MSEDNIPTMDEIGGVGPWRQWFQAQQDVRVKKLVTEILSDRDKANRGTKLTWDSRKMNRGPSRLIGEFDPSRAYILVHKRWIIQNCKVFTTNGVPTSLKFIEENAPLDYPYVARSFDEFIKDATVRDKNLCRVCLAFTTEDHDEYFNHMLSEHPEESKKFAAKAVKKNVAG